MPAILQSMQRARISRVSGVSEVKTTSGRGASEVVTRARVGWKENQRVENSVTGTADRVNEWRGAMTAQRSFVTSLHKSRTFANEVRIAMGFKPLPPPVVDDGFISFPLAGMMGEEQTQLQAARASMEAVATATARKMNLLLKTRITEKEKMKLDKPRRWRTHQKRKK